MLSTLTKGDSAQWDDVPWILNGKTCDSSAYTLKYSLRGPVTLDLTAAVNGNGWRTTLGLTASATLAIGSYTWAAILSSATERITITSGMLSVSADISAAVAGFDGRSVAQIALSDAEAALSTFRASRGRTKKYTIGSRSMEFDTAADIIVEISYWRIKVRNERAASDIADGLGNPRSLYVRFN